MLLVAEEGAWRRWEGAKGRGQLQSLSKVRGKGGAGTGRERLAPLAIFIVKIDGGTRQGQRPRSVWSRRHMTRCLLALPPLPISAKLGISRTGLLSPCKPDVSRAQPQILTHPCEEDSSAKGLCVRDEGHGDISVRFPVSLPLPSSSHSNFQSRAQTPI